MTYLRLKPNQPETVYHVMTRTAQKCFLLSERVKKEIIDPWLDIYTKVFYVEVHNTVYMDNHYHITCTVFKPEKDLEDLQKRHARLQGYLSRPTEWCDAEADKFYERATDLSAFMQTFNWRISWEYNRMNDSWGHLWGARFKSSLVENLDSLASVVAYVELNPVRAVVKVQKKGAKKKTRVTKPSEYRWCTAGKIKRALDAGEAVDAPMIGIFRNIRDNLKRAKAYVFYHDYLARLVYEPELRRLPPPPEIVALGISEENWDKLREEIEEGRPGDWNQPAYGSEDFVKEIQELKRSGRKKAPN